MPTWLHDEARIKNGTARFEQKKNKHALLGIEPLLQEYEPCTRATRLKHHTCCMLATLVRELIVQRTGLAPVAQVADRGVGGSRSLPPFPAGGLLGGSGVA
jgi:hypothetical protein